MNYVIYRNGLVAVLSQDPARDDDLDEDHEEVHGEGGGGHQPGQDGQEDACEVGAVRAEVTCRVPVLCEM